MSPLIHLQVSIPPDDRHAVLLELHDPQIVDGARKLDPTDLLLELFGGEHEPKHVHIVVQAPDTGKQLDNRARMSTESLG